MICVAQVVEAALADAGRTKDDVDWLVLHQVSAFYFKLNHIFAVGPYKIWHRNACTLD